MKIAIVTTVHSEDDIRIYHKEGRSLSHSNNVLLIAPRKSSCVFNDITYFPLKPSHSRLSRISLQQEVLKNIQKTSPDAIHFHDPELIFLAILCKKLGYQVVWDIHEDLPKQILKKHWIPRNIRPILSRAIALLEGFLVPSFDSVICATPSIATRFSGHKNIAIVRNYPLLSEFSDRTTALDADSSFIYTGGLSKERGLEEMLRAIKIVRGSSGATLELAGRFSPAGYEEKLAEKQDGVNYHGWLGRNEIVDLTRKSLAGLVVLHSTPNHVESLPIKMFEYMASGIAVIASDFPLWREIIEKYDCGLLVDPMDPKSIASAMNWMLQNREGAIEMGRRGRIAIETELNWEREFDNLRVAYEKLGMQESKGALCNGP